VDDLVGHGTPRAQLKCPTTCWSTTASRRHPVRGPLQGETLQWLGVGVGVNVANAIPEDLAGRAIALNELLPTCGV